MIQRPLPNEYANFYKGYIDQVPDKPVLDYLEEQEKAFTSFIQNIPDDKLEYAYGPDKWTVKEVIGHMIDTERIMAGRILRFSRGDKTHVPGFEQDDYVAGTNFNSRSITSLADEFHHLRLSNIALTRSLTIEETSYTGEANEVVFSVRALIYILAGHLNHHLAILKERYL